MTAAEAIYEAFGPDVAAEPIDIETLEAGQVAEAFNAHDALGKPLVGVLLVESLSNPPLLDGTICFSTYDTSRKGRIQVSTNNSYISFFPLVSTT
jgi:hypothetical protein